MSIRTGSILLPRLQAKVANSSYYLLSCALTSIGRNSSCSNAYNSSKKDERANHVAMGIVKMARWISVIGQIALKHVIADNPRRLEQLGRIMKTMHDARSKRLPGAPFELQLASLCFSPRLQNRHSPLPRVISEFRKRPQWCRHEDEVA